MGTLTPSTQATNLRRFLQGIGEGILEQAPEDSPADDHHNALRDYGSQLLTAAEAVRDSGDVDWTAIADEIGTDIER